MNLEEKEIYTERDVIDLFKISARTLATWRKKELITYSKIGNKFYYTKNDIDLFLTNNHSKKKNHEENL